MATPYIPYKTAPATIRDWDWKLITKPNPVLIYISSPYTIGDQILNVRRQVELADKILEMGHIPFVPCLAHFWHYLSPKSYEEWLRIDSAIIPRCDALLRVGGESKGADIEVETAKKLRIPVYYSLAELENAYK